MKDQVARILKELYERYPALEACREEIAAAFDLLRVCYEKGGKLLVCGNGGSAADAQHIVGELMKEFRVKRPFDPKMRESLIAGWGEKGVYLADKLQSALPAVSLTGEASLETAFSNDVDAELIYAQRVYGLAKPGDVFMGISTSGNAKNVCQAARCALAMGLTAIGLTGQNGGMLKTICTATIRVPETETFKVQELHLPVYHALCSMLEAEFYL